MAKLAANLNKFPTQVRRRALTISQRCLRECESHLNWKIWRQLMVFGGHWHRVLEFHKMVKETLLKQAQQT